LYNFILVSLRYQQYIYLNDEFHFDFFPQRGPRVPTEGRMDPRVVSTW
jgi:hypothetical protein